MVENRAPQATLPTTSRARGMVVPFRRRLDPGRMPSVAAQTAEKPAPCLVRLYEDRDVVLNSDWDRLITLIADAWCWRDRDCLAAVDDCLAQLRRSVDRDWS